MLGRWPFSFRVLAVAVASLATVLIGFSVPRAPTGSQAAHPTLSVQGLLQVLGTEYSMGSRPSSTADAAGLPTGLRQPKTSAKCAKAPAYGFLHTQGIWIVDKNNCKVRLVGVTWFGMQTAAYVPSGLNFLPYQDILVEIKRLGFNSIRVPLSDELVKDNAKIKVSGKYLLANPGLQGLHPLDVLNKLVAAAKSLRLMIILDNHFSKSLPLCQVNKNCGKKGSARRSVVKRLDEATWTADGYTETQWIRDWLTLARLYRRNPTVIGFDLRNEPHTKYTRTYGGHWTLQKYLTQGATWGPYPSKLWKKSSDWPMAAQKAGDAIQIINPNLLLFVEGVELYPQPQAKLGVEAYWWGSILKGVTTDPIHFSIGRHLVYSPHEWGPWKCCVYESNNTTYASLQKLFYANWAFILHSKSQKIRAPIWLGEFDTCNAKPACVSDTLHRSCYSYGCVDGSQGQWFQNFLRYLRSNPEISWAYYPLDGTNSLDEPSNNSVLNRNWTAPALPSLVQGLHTIEKQPKN